MPASVKQMWRDTRPAGAASPDEPHPADRDYSPPVSTVRLPSRGLVYPPESPLYRCESLDIKAVTAAEEDILSSVALIKKGTVLTTLMRACITNRLVDPDQMLVGDRNAVLVAIRVSAYGPAYRARVECPKCGEPNEQEFDLSRLNLKTLDEDPAGGPGTNEFSYRLPSDGREVRFRLLDATSVARLDRDLEAMRKKGVDRGVTARLVAQVSALAGVEAKDLPRALSQLPARDSRALRNHMDAVAPGVDMEQTSECPACGVESEVEIPIGTGFFWPAGE